MPELPKSKGLVVGLMATYPARFATIAQVVGSIAPQLDRLYLYVNQTLAGLPDLSGFANVVVIDGRAHGGDLSANGKIYPLDHLTDCTVFTLDDDFIYPPDYVARKLTLLDHFDHRCCVTTHGSILPRVCDWYYERTKVLMSRRALARTQPVTLAGSGTFAFSQRTLRVRTADFLPDVMVDLRFSLMAKAQGLPIWCIARDDGWLEHLPGPGLFETMIADPVTHHTLHARQQDWSFESYLPIYRRALKERPPDALAGFDSEFLDCVETGTTPTLWRNTENCYKRRAEFIRAVLPT